MLIARMRLSQLQAQLRHLGAQRIEGAGKLLRDGTEGAERRSELTALGVDEVERIRCHAKEESNFRASVAFVSLINRLRRRAQQPPGERQLIVRRSDGICAAFRPTSCGGS